MKKIILNAVILFFLFSCKKEKAAVPTQQMVSVSDISEWSLHAPLTSKLEATITVADLENLQQAIGEVKVILTLPNDIKLVMPKSIPGSIDPDLVTTYYHAWGKNKLVIYRQLNKVVLITSEKPKSIELEFFVLK